MIPLLSRASVRELDALAASALGVPTRVLMENAGLGAFEVISQRFADRLSRVTLIGGIGQNGGDAWVIARQLVARGHAPRCVLCGAREAVRGDAAQNLASLEKLGVEIACVEEGKLQPLERALSDASLVVDGMFGTGLDRALTGLALEVIARINACAAPRVALDLPSGIDANTGAVLGAAVTATLTLTFAAHKLGLHQHPGAGHAGEVVCIGIGVPAPRSSPACVLEASDVDVLVPPRSADAHKGKAGHVLVIAGAPGRTGAAVLSGTGALRAGAGLVTLCARAGGQAALDAKIVELMSAELPEELDAALAAAIALAADKQALVVGPGLGVDPIGTQLARRLALTLTQPCVLDADALTALGPDFERLADVAAPRILTPHPGEAARMLGTSSAAVQSDRYAAARELARRSNAVAVLKGARTIIAEPSGRIAVCPLDVPALAVAGSGDVLSGVLGALIAQGPAFEAACAGVMLHALAGLHAAHADRGLFARELADALPAALAACRGDSRASS